MAAKAMANVEIIFLMLLTTAEHSKINLKTVLINPIFHARFTGL